jgi:N6-adenosine-specific RNA methylase IME4
MEPNGSKPARLLRHSTVTRRTVSMPQSQNTTLAFHPIADIFPLLEGAAFDALVSDVQANGLREPITLHPDGSILDGRNRYRACLSAGIKPTFKKWDGVGSAVAFVVSLNLRRRHLDESGRAMVAAKIATLQDGQRKSGASIEAASQYDAAGLLNVSRASVQRARVVLDHGTPDVIAEVEQGRMTVSVGAKVAKAPKKTQQAVAKKTKAGVKPTEAMRQVKAEETHARQIAEPTGKYRVIYADPPWSYGNTQPDYHPEQRDHYPTMSLDEVCAVPVAALAEDDAVLFIWVTSPVLAEAFSVITAWGFTYKASFVWDKVKHNMGHYNSVRHEFLLVCTRGSCHPDERKLFDSVVSEERTTHSTKPESFRTIIDTIYPRGKRVELFARSVAKGWDQWGLEVPHA